MKRVFLAVNLPKGLHITLHFLGNQNEKAIRRINKITAEVVKLYGPIRLATGGIGFFPSRRTPQVMYLKVIEKDGRELKKIREKIKRELVKAGFEVDHRPWKPHVTIAWEKGTLNSDGIASSRTPRNDIRVTSIDLMQSHLDPRTSATKSALISVSYELIKSHRLGRAN